MNFLESYDKTLLYIGDTQQLRDGNLPNVVHLDNVVLQNQGVIEKYVDENGNEITQDTVGGKVQITTKSHGQSLTRYIVNELAKNNLVEILGGKSLSNYIKTRLTSQGWLAYQKLKNKGSNQRLGFVALQFSGEPYTSVLDEYIKPAVKEVGYELITVGDDKTTNLIDNKIRMNIRLSHFVIVDISFGNKGAYWEAGYAEALGKPVIYIINEDVWNDDELRKKNVHFDAEHQTIYTWNISDMSPFLEELKATIQVNTAF